MCFHDLPLLFIERTWLLKNGIGNRNLPNIVQKCTRFYIDQFLTIHPKSFSQNGCNLGHPLAMFSSRFLPRFEHRNQCFQRKFESPFELLQRLLQSRASYLHKTFEPPLIIPILQQQMSVTERPLHHKLKRAHIERFTYKVVNPGTNRANRIFRGRLPCKKYPDDRIILSKKRL